MILDWNAQCYKIHTTRKLDRSDPSDNKSIFSQETHYIKFLLMREIPYRDIYYHWTRIKNGMAAAFKDDPELQVATFGRIYKAAENISEKSFKHHYATIRIYKSEVDFLNSIKAPIWVKQYWMAMLVYWKFASQHTKNVVVDSTLCNWAMRHTQVKDTRYGLYQDKIAQYNRLESGYVINTGIIKRKNCRVYWFDWVGDRSDEEFVEIKNLDNCKKALKLISANVQICSLCGKQFKASSRQRTTLCPECYKKERRKYKTAKDIERYHKQKSQIRSE